MEVEENGLTYTDKKKVGWESFELWQKMYVWFVVNLQLDFDTQWELAEEDEWSLIWAFFSSFMVKEEEIETGEETNSWPQVPQNSD